MIQVINIAYAGVITDAPRLTSVGISALNFLLSIFGVVAIIMLAVSGAKYFLALGDAQAAEEAKAAAKNAVLGVIVVMGGMVIVKLVGSFFK